MPPKRHFTAGTRTVPGTTAGRALLTLLLGALLTLLPGRAAATHIVGGQLGMKYISRGVYDLSLTLYFDVVNGSPGAFDSLATMVTYERGRGRRGAVDTVSLPLVSRLRVSYTNPGCQNSSLITDEVQYARRVFLNPARYASQRGYYVSWQRAARNAVISNIQYVLYGSNPPQPFINIGQTFYLEFPALRTTTGADFVNSSPTNFKPLNDYACAGRAFRYPFGGTDPDGDSLVYDVVSPLQMDLDSIVAGGGISAAPYPPITWAPGYDSLRQITGAPPLRVSRRTGELSFTAFQPGLYVFAMRVREYRRGRLLGEMRREFQELVLNCTLNQEPVLTLTVPGPPRTGPILTNGQIVTLPAAGVPGERCLNVYAIDPDTTTRLRLRIVPVDSISSRPQLTITTGVVNVGGRRDSLYSRLCFPDCFTTGNVPLRLWVIAEDEGCPRPQPDTVLLIVRAPGTLGAPTRLALTPGTLAYDVGPGQTVAFALTGSNADGQPVTVGAVDVNGAPLSNIAGLQSIPVTAPGAATGLFAWPITCATPPGTYAVRLRASVPGAVCNPAGAVDTIVTVRVAPLPVDLTTVFISSDQGPGQNYMTAAPGTVVAFDVIGMHTASDVITLTAPDLTSAPLAGLGITFTGQPALQAVSAFRWAITCATPPGTYRIRFRASVGAAACIAAGQADTAAYITVPPGAATFDTIAPNVITPNADNLNDRFAPRFSRSGLATDCEAGAFRRLQVFSRWGRRVFETTDEATGWGAADAAAGTYYYLLEYTNRPNIKGWLEVVR